MDDWRLVWEELELLDIVSDATGSPFRKRETPTHLSSLEGSWRGTATFWVSSVAKAINPFCAGSTGRFVAVSCAGTVPKPKILAFLKSSSLGVDLCKRPSKWSMMAKL